MWNVLYKICRPKYCKTPVLASLILSLLTSKDEKLDHPSRSGVLSNNVILCGLETALLLIKRSSDNQNDNV